MSKISRKALLEKIREGSVYEVLVPGMELKSSWERDYGKKISSIANNPNKEGGWIIIGLDDRGHLLKKEKEWLVKVESEVRNHISTYLNPDFTVVDITGEDIDGSHILIMEIRHPDDIVYWNSKAYKPLGTSCQEMAPDELISLSLKLPGADFSKLEYHGDIVGSLVINYAEKLAEAGLLEKEELQSLSSSEVLSKLSLSNRKASGILFGDITVRVIHYDINGDILDQREEKGLYSILQDDFIESLQSWTRKQGTIVLKNSSSATEESPYPIKALRDSLANAVAHALYTKNNGEVRVELHPDRLAISNNCSLEAKYFINKWFSNESKSHNKLLMLALRAAKITDELGSGKTRIFRLMMEAGKKEPIIEFTNNHSYGRWKITLYNNEGNLNLLRLIEKLKQKFPLPDYWRLAAALVLWKDKSIEEIKETLDEHHKKIADSILENNNSPVSLFPPKGKLFLKRWAKVAIIDGQESKAFTLAEENNLKEFLNYYAYKLSSEGNISNKEASNIIGLSTSSAERTQLSRLFRKWEQQGIVENIKRGEWRFIHKPEFSGL